MTNKIKKGICLLVFLIIALFNFTSCAQECATPFCRNNAQLFKDLCRDCKETSDAINNTIDGLRNLFE